MIRKKPLLIVAHEDAKVTRLIIDPPWESYSFRRYKNLVEDVPFMVKESLDKLGFSP